MRNLVAYKQSLTKATMKWNPPYRREDGKWILVKREHLKPHLLCNERGVFRGAILKMKKIMEKMRTENNRPVWHCIMTSKEMGVYRTYHLICKRIK